MSPIVSIEVDSVQNHWFEVEITCNKTEDQNSERKSYSVLSAHVTSTGNSLS